MSRNINIRPNLNHENIRGQKWVFCIHNKFINNNKMMCIPYAWYCVKFFTFIILFKYSKTIIPALLYKTAPSFAKSSQEQFELWLHKED